MKQIDAQFFPGFLRKSLTFTIDDGNIPLDKKFLNIVRKHGILGSFNLCDTGRCGLSDGDYRALYAGYEITNHCKDHPYALDPEREYTIAAEPFSEQSADAEKIYPVEGKPGEYMLHVSNGWRLAADRQTYLSLAREAREELEKTFGQGSVRAFVWPYGMQKDSVLFEQLCREYESVRMTGDVRDSTGFALPADRTRWSYNIAHNGLIELAEQYRAYPDDGELKFFCFGLHSHDYENAGKWGMLEEFAERFGDRPQEFYYATVGQIFDYQDAIASLSIENGAIFNRSHLPLYLKIDGQKVILPPHAPYEI